MATYTEIQAQIAELQIQAETARSSEISAAKAKIAEIMKEHGLTLPHLGGVAKARLLSFVQPFLRNTATRRVVLNGLVAVAHHFGSQARTRNNSSSSNGPGCSIFLL